VQPILALERSDKSPCEICGYATPRSEEGGEVTRTVTITDVLRRSLCDEWKPPLEISIASIASISINVDQRSSTNPEAALQAYILYNSIHNDLFVHKSR
jgi:hypothetical protein